jgi:PAS domain-containing protein
MRFVCSYCRVAMGEDPSAAVQGTSHGMCRDCSDHFARLWEGMSLSEYLDTVPAPVAVMDGRGRVLGANREHGALAGGTEAEEGGAACRAFACAWSRRPEGCGATVHCRECTIRRVVRRVQETGEPVVGARAWLQTGDGLLDLRISVSREREVVRVVVEEATPAARRPEADA